MTEEDGMTKLRINATIREMTNLIMENTQLLDIGNNKNQTNMEIVERTCKECGQLTKVGKTTGECLKCLDWKMGDLRK